jgi:anaerobic ribonucleoside-triphosphate reductase activating protein
MSYSGFTIAALRRGTPEQQGLLARLDLLIDGPYQRARHGSLRWRGSANQRIIPLSERYRDLVTAPDESQGIEFTLGADGAFSWAGVPGEPGFRELVEQGLASRGFELHEENAAQARKEST